MAGIKASAALKKKHLETVRELVGGRCRPEVLPRFDLAWTGAHNDRSRE
jgi:hypothetical protein